MDCDRSRDGSGGNGGDLGGSQKIHHVQLAMPCGREGEARGFDPGLLGITEQPKPEHVDKRGGCWFSNGDLKIHLGVDNHFRPALQSAPGVAGRRPAGTDRRATSGGSPRPR